MTQPEVDGMDLTLMRLEYVLAPDEFLEGQQVFCSSLGSRWVRFNFKGLIPIGILLMVEGVVAIIFKADLFAEILLPLLGAYFIFSRLVLWPRKVTREYDQYPDHAGGRSVEFDEDGRPLMDREIWFGRDSPSLARQRPSSFSSLLRVFFSRFPSVRFRQKRSVNCVTCLFKNWATDSPASPSLSV